MIPMKDRVDPEMMPIWNMLEGMGFYVDLNDIQETRDRLGAVAEQLAAGAPPIEGVDLAVHEAPYADGSFNVPLRVTRPEGQTDTLPVLYWMHGGGYVLNDAAGDDALAAHFALTLNCVVVAVDYRLAPENPFPVPLEDCYVGLKWTYDNAATLNADPARIAIGGQSAGAGLAAGLAQVTRDRGEVPLIFQMLTYPMIDDRNIEQATAPEMDHYVWSRHSNLVGWRSYLGMEPGTDATPKYAAPARTEDLAGLPPTYISTGDVDLFLAEDLAYATRLIAAGVPTEVHVYPGGIHAFDVVGGTTALGQQSNTDRDKALKVALHG
jgi:acetyl esterase/lipase